MQRDYSVFQPDPLIWKEKLILAEGELPYEFKMDLEKKLIQPEPFILAERIKFFLDENIPPIDIFKCDCLTHILISNRLEEILRIQHIAFEIFHVDLYSKTTEKKLPLKYGLLHLQDVRNGLDINKSVFERPKFSNATNVLKIELSEDIFRESPCMFREKSRRSIIFIHKTLGITLQNAGITGFKLIPVDKYQSIIINN